MQKRFLKEHKISSKQDLETVVKNCFRKPLAGHCENMVKQILTG